MTRFIDNSNSTTQRAAPAERDPDEAFWRQTERLLEEPARRDPDERFWRETDAWLERGEWEEAADRVEELSAGWTDWRGFPQAGFESPRFLTEREREYKRWYRGSSPEAARARHARGD